MPKPTLFLVTDELQQVLNNLPALEPKSRLDPLCAFIMRWRREGRSYRKIQQILENECKVRVHNETLRRFVKRRLKPRKPKLDPQFALEGEQPTNSPAPQPANQPVLTRYPQAQPGEDPWAEQRERMRRHKEAPAAARLAKVFEVSEDDLDPTKPLRMMTPTPKEK